MLAFIVSSIRLGMAFLFGSTGETITEKSGHLNLGIPGVMCVGTVVGCAAEVVYFELCGGKLNMIYPLAVLIPVIATLLGGALMVWQLLCRRKEGRRGKQALLEGLHSMKQAAQVPISGKVFLLIFAMNF